MGGMKIKEKSQAILQKLCNDSFMGKYVDNREMPSPFHGSGEIKLIILGQDPTVKDTEARALITTVLNLNKKRALRNYLNGICRELGLELDRNIYATNVVKNFFIDPPTQIKENEQIDVLDIAGMYWLTLLREEIEQFPNASILSLGEPILSLLVTQGSKLIKDYWGYKSTHNKGQHGEFKYIDTAQSIVGRVIFPFPHQPSMFKKFYKNSIGEYTAFMKIKCSSFNC